jgi:hypothetical protein
MIVVYMQFQIIQLEQCITNQILFTHSISLYNKIDNYVNFI